LHDGPRWRKVRVSLGRQQAPTSQRVRLVPQKAV